MSLTCYIYKALLYVDYLLNDDEYLELIEDLKQEYVVMNVTINLNSYSGTCVTWNTLGAINNVLNIKLS